MIPNKMMYEQFCELYQLKSSDVEELKNFLVELYESYEIS